METGTTDLETPCAAPEVQPAPLDNRASLRLLWHQAWRSSIFFRPQWHGLPASPWLVAALTLTHILLRVLLDRALIAGPADFYWQAIHSVWIGFVALAWACYALRPEPTVDCSNNDTSASASHLLSLVLAQGLVVHTIIGLVFVGLIRLGWYPLPKLPVPTQWLIFLLPMAWIFISQMLIIWRGGNRQHGAMLVATLAMAGAMWLANLEGGVRFWYPVQEAADQPERKQLDLTQKLMEAQPVLLAQRLAEVLPQRAGVTDLYSITFAPYASEDVFHNETTMVTQVMSKRFDAAGRTLQLVNHVDTVQQHPWATPLNLQRAITALAKRMDLNEDILFLHLTSHGARDGVLAAEFWPMTVDELTPKQLKQWLDEAGIKNRVISVSACYSGSWIAPLASDGTLIMTAADANHTSYGCGRKSKLTFFGRAMYDEQLRNKTRSFEAAHAAARTIIKQREQAAGKDDGYSNPQIRPGSAIQVHLKRLQDRLQDRVQDRVQDRLPAAPGH
jgi:Peptidase C13 family